MVSALRGLLILCCVLLAGPGAFAQEFMGRKVEITDGRSTTAAPAPLIIAMHGFLGTSSTMRKKTQFDALARRHGFVVAYPNGVRRSWNDGRGTVKRSDDVGYLADLIGALVADGRADPERVFLAGHSNGGGMALRMACDRAGLIRGIAVVATKVPSAYRCAGGAAVPAIFFYGTEDPISPPEGRPEGSRLGAALSAEASLALWETRNRCRGIAGTQAVDRQDDGTSAEIIQYARCHAPLVYVRIEGHGHDWPGKGRRKTRLQGPATKEVDAAQLSWWFFEQL